jgi:hypothetical protein
VSLREEQRLRVFEDRVLRRISGPSKGEVTGNKEEGDGKGMYRECGSRRMNIGYWLESQKEKDH